jgi:hypothetical protein
VREKVLARQTAELNRAFKQLHRSAEADLRTLHVSLLRMAIEQPDLAPVWPGYEHLDPDRARQFLYANLIYGHLYLHYQLGNSSSEELRANLRLSVRTARFREYWEHARPWRNMLDHSGPEWQFAALVEAVLKELPS